MPSIQRKAQKAVKAVKELFLGREKTPEELDEEEKFQASDARARAATVEATLTGIRYTDRGLSREILEEGEFQKVIQALVAELNRAPTTRMDMTKIDHTMLYAARALKEGIEQGYPNTAECAKRVLCKVLTAYRVDVSPTAGMDPELEAEEQRRREKHVAQYEILIASNRELDTLELEYRNRLNTQKRSQDLYEEKRGELKTWLDTDDGAGLREEMEEKQHTPNSMSEEAHRLANLIEEVARRQVLLNETAQELAVYRTKITRQRLIVDRLANELQQETAVHDPHQLDKSIKLLKDHVDNVQKLIDQSAELNKVLKKHEADMQFIFNDPNISEGVTGSLVALRKMEEQEQEEERRQEEARGRRLEQEQAQRQEQRVCYTN